MEFSVKYPKLGILGTHSFSETEDEMRSRALNQLHKKKKGPNWFFSHELILWGVSPPVFGI
jgi:hypothetical protein